MRGNSEHQGTRDTLDKLKWLAVLVLIIAIVWGNYYFSHSTSIYPMNFMVRIILMVFLAVMILWLVATTQKGKQILLFFKESRLELRKVVWPTRKEAIQTTVLIAVITIIASLFLWGLDSITIRLVTFLTLLGH